MTNESTEVEQVAAVVEADRVDLADAVEVDREERAAIVESLRIQAAALLESDRKEHNARMAALWTERARVVNRRFLVLFVALTVAFLLLAYRSEMNAAANRQTGADLAAGLYHSCVVRRDTAIRYNDGREALVQLVATSLDATDQTPTERALITQQLRDGLLLPIEDCGTPP